MSDSPVHPTPSLVTPASESDFPDQCLAVVLAFVAAVLFWRFHQPALEFNGAAYLAWTRDPPHVHEHHAAYLQVLWCVTHLLGPLGMPRVDAGILLSNLGAGMAVGIQYLLARAFRLPRGVSFVGAVALAISYPLVLTGTTVETYPFLFAFSGWMLLEARNLATRGTLLAACRLALVSVMGIGFHLGAVLPILAIGAGGSFWALAARHRRSATPLWLFPPLVSMATALAPMIMPGVSHGISRQADWSRRYLPAYDGLWNRLADGLLHNALDFLAVHPFVILLFPLGLVALRATERWLLPAAVVAHLLHLGFYGFWVRDHGAFYAPLYPLDILLACIGLSRLAIVRDAAALGVFLALLAFLQARHATIVSTLGTSVRDWGEAWSIAIQIVMVAIVIGWAWRSPAGRGAPRLAMVVLSGLVCVQLATLVPLARPLWNTADGRLRFEAAQALAPRGGLLYTHDHPYYVTAYTGNLTGCSPEVILSALRGHVARNAYLRTQTRRVLAGGAVIFDAGISRADCVALLEAGEWSPSERERVQLHAVMCGGGEMLIAQSLPIDSDRK